MSDLVWIVYVVDTVLDVAGELREFLMAILIVGGIALAFAAFIVNFDSCQEDKDKWNPRLVKSAKFGLVPATLLCFLLALVPSSDTAYKMLAVYGATELAQLEEVQEMGGKSLEVINKVMDDYLAEAKDDR